jgi:hypothetical protein
VPTVTTYTGCPCCDDDESGSGGSGSGSGSGPDYASCLDVPDTLQLDVVSTDPCINGLSAPLAGSDTPGPPPGKVWVDGVNPCSCDNTFTLTCIFPHAVPDNLVATYNNTTLVLADYTPAPFSLTYVLPTDASACSIPPTAAGYIPAGTVFVVTVP